MTATSGRITRDDLEAGFRSLEGEVDERKEQAMGVAAMVGVAAVVGIIVVAYALGRRRGRKKTTVVEIRRV